MTVRLTFYRDWIKTAKVASVDVSPIISAKLVLFWFGSFLGTTIVAPGWSFGTELKRKSFFQVLSKKKNNYDLIFKESTNLGRHLVFGQFKIPVITEPTPSVIKFFDDESMEYIVHDENSWFKVLKKLIIDRDLRSSLGIKLYKIWQRNFRHEVLNKKLVKILDEIKKS